MMFMKRAVERADESSQTGERLQKILAQAGIASRRAAEQIILEGRVQVNGQTVTELGTKADLSRDHIRVDGKLLHGREPERYFLLNKPRGYVTTMDDPEGRPTVARLLGESAQKKVTGEHKKLATALSGGAARLSQRRPAADDQRRRARESAVEGQ